MNEKLVNIKVQLENLLSSINDYLDSSTKGTKIINKEDFHKIKHLGKLNSYIHVFDYDEGIIFTLRESPSYSYEYQHYRKIMSGELDRLILNRKEPPVSDGIYFINYELESLNKTKLRDLYGV